MSDNHQQQSRGRGGGRGFGGGRGGHNNPNNYMGGNGGGENSYHNNNNSRGGGGRFNNNSNNNHGSGNPSAQQAQFQPRHLKATPPPNPNTQVDFAFDSLAELYSKGKTVLGHHVVFPTTADWFKIVHQNERGDFSQLPLVWTNCHQPWTFERMTKEKEAEEARIAGVSGGAAAKGGSSISQKERSEYGMSSANTNYGDRHGAGGSHFNNNNSNSAILKMQQEQLTKYLQALTRTHPILKLCADVVVGGKVTAFMAPMCSPLTKASFRYLTSGREGAGVEATDDERIVLARTLKKHGLLPRDCCQPIYRSRASDHRHRGDDLVTGGAGMDDGGQNEGGGGGGGGGDDDDAVVEDVEASGHIGPRKYWITEKSDGLRVVICSQKAHNFPRWTKLNAPPPADSATSSSSTAASSWLSHLQAPPLYPAQNSPIGASLADTIVLESARSSVAGVWGKTVMAIAQMVTNHCHKTLKDDTDEERNKLMDNTTIQLAVLSAVATALAETLGTTSAADSSSEPLDDSVSLPFDLPPMDVLYNGVRNIPNVVSCDVEGGSLTSILFVESDQIKFAASGAFVLRIPIPLAFFSKHLERAMKESFKFKLDILLKERAAAAAAANDGSGAPISNAAPQQRHAPQPLTPVFILVQKTARGDGGAIILNRRLEARHFTYLFDRSMSHVYCMTEEYPFRLNCCILDAELIVAIPPATVVPEPNALTPTLKLSTVPPPPAPQPLRKAFFAVFDLFAFGKETPRHNIFNDNHPLGRTVPYRPVVSNVSDLQLLNRTSTKERWDLLGSEVLDPMLATGAMIVRAMGASYRQNVAELTAKHNAQLASSAGDGATTAEAPPAAIQLPPPPRLTTLTMFRKEMWAAEELPACLALIRKTRFIREKQQQQQEEEHEEAAKAGDDDVEEHYLFRGLTLNDGLIFTPDDFDIIAGSRRNQLKWKWPDKLTVDWKITPLPNKVLPIPVLDENNKDVFHTPQFQRRIERLKDMQTWEYFKVDMFFRRKKKPVDLAGDSEYRRSLRLLNPKSIAVPQGGCVAECSYNSAQKLWQIEKIRKDKFESNAVITIMSVMSSACEGLDVACLLASLGFLAQERAAMLVSQYLRLSAGAEVLLPKAKQALLTAAGKTEEELQTEAALEEIQNEKRLVDAELERRAAVEAAVMPEFSDFVAKHALGLATAGEGDAISDDNAYNPEEEDEEEKAQRTLRKNMMDLSAKLPMVLAVRGEKAAICAKEREAVDSYNNNASPAAAAGSTHDDGENEDIAFHAIDSNSVSTVVHTPQSIAATRPSYIASIPRCNMALSLSSKAGGGQAAKALFLQWHAKIAVQRNSIPCNHVMVSECYGLGEECPALRSGSRLIGEILIQMANSGGCYAWTDTVAEVMFDPLTGRWGIVSIDTNGNKNRCYGTEAIAHLEAIANANAHGKKYLIPKTLRNLNARPPLGTARPIDALNGGEPDAANKADAADVEEGDANTSHNGTTGDDDVTTSSAVNAAHYALRTVELRDNDETSRVRRFNNWVKAVLMANAASLVRAELSKFEADNKHHHASASTSAAAGKHHQPAAEKKAAALAAMAKSNDSSLLAGGNDLSATPIAVAELCCGRGGDLHKWRNHISGGYLLMIDHCFEAVAEAARRYSVGKGLSTKVVEGKDGYPGIPAHFAVKSCFSDGIIPIVETCKATAPRPGLIEAGFHIVSCQFSMHYAFQTEVQVRNFLANVSSTLRVGGLFIGTTCDAAEIRARKARHGNRFGNGHYSITFDVSDSEIVQSADNARAMSGGKATTPSSDDAPLTAAACYGTPYRFSLESSVVSEVEYLVDWDRFAEMANRDYGLVCIEASNFSAFRSKHVKTAGGKKLWDEFLGDEALRHRGLKAARSAAEPDSSADARLDGDVSVLSQEEEEAVSLYKAFVFQKLN